MSGIVTGKSPSLSEYILQNIGIALWLIPVLAWYDWFNAFLAGYMTQPNSLTNLALKAIILTIVVFLIMSIFRRPSPVMVQPVGVVAAGV